MKRKYFIYVEVTRDNYRYIEKQQQNEQLPTKRLVVNKLITEARIRDEGSS